MLGHSHLSSSRSPRMSQIMKREIHDLSLSACTRERLLSVNESRPSLVAGEDIFAGSFIFTQHLHDGRNSLTHRNRSRLTVLSLLYKEPAWKYFPDLSLNNTTQTDGTKVHIVTLESEQLTLTHPREQSHLGDGPQVFASTYESNIKERLLLCQRETTIPLPTGWYFSSHGLWQFL